MTQENIIDKVKKLLNHEKSAREIGNVAEAEAFAAKAQEILFNNKLSMTDVEVAEQEKNEPVLSEFLTTEELVSGDGAAKDVGTRKQSWIGILLMAVAEANFCRVVASNSRDAYHLIGRESDRAAVQQLFKYLHDACLEVVAVKSKEYKLSGEYSRLIEYSGKSPVTVLRTFTSGFKLGFASAIYDRLKKQRAELKAAETTSTALIRLDKIETALDTAVKQQFPKLRTGGAARTKSVAGFASGHSYGTQIGINSSKRLR